MFAKIEKKKLFTHVYNLLAWGVEVTCPHIFRFFSEEKQKEWLGRFTAVTHEREEAFSYGLISLDEWVASQFVLRGWQKTETHVVITCIF